MRQRSDMDSAYLQVGFHRPTRNFTFHIQGDTNQGVTAKDSLFPYQGFPIRLMSLKDFHIKTTSKCKYKSN